MTLRPIMFSGHGISFTFFLVVFTFLLRGEGRTPTLSLPDEREDIVAKVEMLLRVSVIPHSIPPFPSRERELLLDRVANLIMSRCHAEEPHQLEEFERLDEAEVIDIRITE